MWQVQGILNWANNRTREYRGVEIRDFTYSWINGMAFCALLHSYRPDLIPFNLLSPEDVKYNLTLAFTEAQNIGIPHMMDPDDVFMVHPPDEKSIALCLTEWYKELEDKNRELDEHEQLKLERKKKVQADWEAQLSDKERTELYENLERQKKGREDMIAEKEANKVERRKATEEEIERRKSMLKCGRCGEQATEDLPEFDGKKFHTRCYYCFACNKPLKKNPTPNAAWSPEGILVCENCAKRAETRVKANEKKAPPSRLPPQARDPNAPSVGKNWEDRPADAPTPDDPQEIARRAELKRIEEARKSKPLNPFQEEEKKREEERRKKFDQMSRAPPTASVAQPRPVQPAPQKAQPSLASNSTPSFSSTTVYSPTPSVPNPTTPFTNVVPTQTTSTPPPTTTPKSTITPTPVPPKPSLASSSLPSGPPVEIEDPRVARERELKRLAEEKKNKPNPFKEAERLREEERKRKQEAFQKRMAEQK
eukprot:TRINITY_DN13596_c0_g1_i1.p1 TRINITY_DN13596_c0_g1~~TRINITY_DN13596_c0_g1_i1.p1  ORF type:complete len:480 (-),score=140.03 TRINITY_DN13596_c0_g1_i1:35-1474(-)